MSGNILAIRTGRQRTGTLIANVLETQWMEKDFITNNQLKEGDQVWEFSILHSEEKGSWTKEELKNRGGVLYTI